jgi:hypothetical protein
VGRGALLWLLLFAVYAGTLGLRAGPAGDYGPGEAHRLLLAESIVSDRDIDLADEYRQRAWTDFYDGELRPAGRLTDHRRAEPTEVGLALLIAPGYALAGPTGAELVIAALAALAFVLSAALARRLVPDPWATAAPLVVGLSPPALAYATAIYPEMPAAAALAAAILLALRTRERPRVRWAAAAAACLAVLPWLGLKYLPAAAVVGSVLVAWMLKRHRGLAALVAAEVAFTSLVTFVSFNDAVYSGLTPFAALSDGASATGAQTAGAYAGRVDRLVGLWLDREFGLLRWAPFLALAFLGAWLLWRSRRERVARAVPEQADRDAAAGLLCAAVLAQILTAAFLAPFLAGPWFAGRQAVATLPLLAALAAWGLRHAPRVGTLLAAFTLAGSVWLYLALRLGDDRLVHPTTGAPWGPLEALLPRSGTPYADVVALAALAALAALGGREWLRRRRARAAALPRPVG